jgi:hypothetical protein
MLTQRLSRWFLATRTWLSSQITLTYRIIPSQCRTRLPVKAFEEEHTELDNILYHHHPVAVDSDEWSPISYLLVMIQFATVVRQIVDMINTQQQHKTSTSDDDESFLLNAENLQKADDQLDLLVDDLPIYYSLDAEYAPSERHTTSRQKRIECERWLIHQQLFDMQIKLHSASSSSSSEEHSDLVS